MSTKVGRKKTKKVAAAKEATNGAEPASPSEPTLVASPAKAPLSVATSQTGLSQEQAFFSNATENNDLETLRRLKETILNGQHPFFKATPQVAHLQALRVTDQTFSHNGVQAHQATNVLGQEAEDVAPRSPYGTYDQHDAPYPIERNDDLRVIDHLPPQDAAPHDEAPLVPETRDIQMADLSDSVQTGPVLGDSSVADTKPQAASDRFPDRARYHDASGRRSPRPNYGAGRDNWEPRNNRTYPDGRYRDYGGINRSVSSGGTRRLYQDRSGGPLPNDQDPYPDSRAYDYNRDRRREPPHYIDDRRPGDYYNPKSSAQRPYDNGRPPYPPPPLPHPEQTTEEDRRSDIYRHDESRPPAPADVKPLVAAPSTESVAVSSASTQDKLQIAEPPAAPDEPKSDVPAPSSDPPAVRSTSIDVVRPSFRVSSPSRSDTRDPGRFGGPDARGPPNRNVHRVGVAGSRIDRDFRPHDDMRPPYIPARDYPEPPSRVDQDPRYPPPIPGGPPYDRTAPPPHIREDPRPPYDPRDRDYRDSYSRPNYPPPPDDRRFVRDLGPPPVPPQFVDDPRYPPPPKDFGRPLDLDRRRDLDRGDRGYDRERGYNNRERDVRPPPLDMRDTRGVLPPSTLPPRSAYLPDRDRDVGRAPLSARISPRGSDQFAPPPPLPESRGYDRPGYGGPPPPPGGPFLPRENPRVRPRSLSPTRRDYRPDDRPPMKRPRPDEPYVNRPPPPPASGYGPSPAAYPPPPPRPHDATYPPDRRASGPPPSGPPPSGYYTREPRY